MTFNYKPVDEVRDRLIGLKIVDIELKGRVIHLEDEEGRTYVIDNTGEGGAVAHAFPTAKEDLRVLERLFQLLLQKLGIDEDGLWELYE